MVNVHWDGVVLAITIVCTMFIAAVVAWILLGVSGVRIYVTVETVRPQLRAPEVVGAGDFEEKLETWGVPSGGGHPRSAAHTHTPQAASQSCPNADDYLQRYFDEAGDLLRDAGTGNDYYRFKRWWRMARGSWKYWDEDWGWLDPGDWPIFDLGKRVPLALYARPPPLQPNRQQWRDFPRPYGHPDNY